MADGAPAEFPLQAPARMRSPGGRGGRGRGLRDPILPLRIIISGSSPTLEIQL